MDNRYLIAIGADFVPTETNSSLFENGDINKLLGDELQRLLDHCDYKVFNLEMPLCDELSPIEKRGPKLSARTSAIKAYKELGVDLFTLANNHIYDQGINGLVSTFNTLNSAGIEYIGASTTKEEAKNSRVVVIGGTKIGFYACCEHEFSVATDQHGGANAFSSLSTFDEIKDLRLNCDLLIVLYHGGKEHFRYPSPTLQKVCRKMAECGADLILCQHSHCIGAMEKYLNSTIVYGQGNFLFDHSNSEYWKTGLLVTVDYNLDVDFQPIVKNNETVRLGEGKVREDIILQFMDRSHEIETDGFVESNYSAFAAEASSYYLRLLSGITKKNLVFHILNKISHGRWEKYYVKRKYNQEALLALQNIIECEAHNEILLTGIKELRKKHE